MNLFKRYWRLLIFFCIGILVVETSVLAVNTQNQSVQSVQNGANELVESGKKYYDLGQFQASITDLEQALVIFDEQKDKLKQAIILSNLSLGYQQLGNWEKAEDAIAKSLALLAYNPETKITNFTKQEQNIIASTLNIYGRLLFQKGETYLALENWQKAEDIFQILNNNQGVISNKINRVKALQILGNYEQSTNLVRQIQEDLAQNSLPIQIQGLQSLAEVLPAIGKSNESEKLLQKSLELAKQINSKKEINSSLLSLGNTYWSLGKIEANRSSISHSYEKLPWECQINSGTNSAQNYYQKAENSYQEVINLNAESTDILKAKINLFNLLVESAKLKEAEQIFSTIDLTKLVPSQANIYAKLNFARHLSCLETEKIATNINSKNPSFFALKSQNKLALTNNSDVNQQAEIEKILLQIKREAENLQDQRSLSYANGNLGSFYEYLSLDNPDNSKLLIKAQNFTEQALLAAQPSNFPSIAYQWQWQLGRIYARKNRNFEAISSYQNAVKSLQKVRSDLLGITADVQFSFRDNVEPVYRQLVKLLLTAEGDIPSQETLESAVNLIDSLQLAELENFLNCDLGTLTSNSETFNQLGTAVFIYPIMLENSLDVIYKLPNQPLQYQVNQVSRIEVEETVEKLRKAIARRNPEILRENSTKIYQWLIQPVINSLEKSSEIDSLIFVLDGVLRNVPMAVLYDSENQEYLVEKNYALALLPTSQLLNLQDSFQQVKVLGAAISKALEVEEIKFSSLNTEAELDEIKQLATTETLINEQFTQESLQQKLTQGDYSILHLATHGNFSSDPQQTYLLAYGKLLRQNDINNLLRSRNEGKNKAIDLLILSACQTASGDNRATLGLAGLAIRAGAQSTLASLWRVSDEYTLPLISQFYENLNRGLSKAEALHQAQKALIYKEINGEKYQNEPYDWGAYVLVGNWQ